MEMYLRKFMRSLLDHVDTLNEFVDELYKNESRENELNAMFGELESENLINLKSRHFIPRIMSGQVLP